MYESRPAPSVGFAEAAERESFSSHVSSMHAPVGIWHEPLCGTHWSICAPLTE
jgi:hypothetical protein